MPEEVQAYKFFAGISQHQKYKLCVAETGVGKTCAAATTQRMIDLYKPRTIIFTGLAGALDESLKAGDIGIGIAAIDADMDLRSFDASYQRGEMLFTRERLFYSDAMLVKIARNAPVKKLFDAYIATGSAFLNKQGKKEFIKQANPELAASLEGAMQQPNLYEMEGSAVLQVAQKNNVPALALRVVSDTLNGDAVKDFKAFIKKETKHCASVVEFVLEGINP